MNWDEDNRWEREWWETCSNTTDEEIKQFTHAALMGLKFTPNEKKPHRINMDGKSVIDIGGGPVSLLLKCFDLGHAIVVDPCLYPDWVYDRYKLAGISSAKCRGEDMDAISLEIHDEVWMYNCLQHVQNPVRLVANARRYGRIVRVCEPIGTRVTPGHPQTFSQDDLDTLFGGEGKVSNVNENGLNGLLYHGIFKGDSYAK